MSTPPQSGSSEPPATGVPAAALRGGVRAEGRDAGAASPEELRSLFLFESLDEEKLAWLAERGRLRDYDTDIVLYAEGSPHSRSSS